jgi:hypothetical protein
METADPFAQQGADAPEGEPTDPFAGDGSSDIPTVNAEGERVEQAAPEEPSEAEREQAEKRERAQEIMAREQAEAEAAEAPAAPQEGQDEAEAAPEPQTATDGGQEPSPAPQADAAADADPAPTAGGDAPQDTSQRGKAEMRYYKLLYLSAERQWTEFELDPTAEGQTDFVKLVDGEPWMVARNNDHAKRIGFTILGRPQQGVRLFPVPKGAWKPSTVKPAPPKPERERLEIS